MVNEEIDSILDILTLIRDDNNVPKNIKSKINSAICCLNNDEKELSLKINSVLQELDDVSNDKNLPPYTRVEILNLIGMLGRHQ